MEQKYQLLKNEQNGQATSYELLFIELSWFPRYSSYFTIRVNHLDCSSYTAFNLLTHFLVHYITFTELELKYSMDDVKIMCNIQSRVQLTFFKAATWRSCFWTKPTSCFLLQPLQSYRKLGLSLCSPLKYITFVVGIFRTAHPPCLKLVPKESAFFV